MATKNETENETGEIISRKVFSLYKKYEILFMLEKIFIFSLNEIIMLRNYARTKLGITFGDSAGQILPAN